MTVSIPLIISDMGENALLCQLPDMPLSVENQKRIWALAEASSHLDGVEEIVPGMNNLLVVFNSLHLEADKLNNELQSLWKLGKSNAQKSRILEIPVRYGGQYGEDLEWMAQKVSLSIEEFVNLHANADYTVFALGAQPGFGYLGGLNAKLGFPRRQVPRIQVQAGAVIIGGNQTAVQSRTSPSGWHIIGFTEIEFFDPCRADPALLRPGDKIKFVVEEIVK